ncbi:VPDSG-CTERM sorting domain-containing protein [Pelagicoccus sp. SDUM812005]|uniref:VPDSG-CTERM sorting domain-containing protein n=1 Tax=Pelagicoccus sp. SDUM812005 TaxID=3041257 RepID=UPI0028102CAD|nr:VPDSG-CTERM sorting domain-containing protein [Pelagicoccus sp. SDUM812005]MDQ8183724.1 VPDSG-CTERM sorting domain-containing protein [Pelagicoccus sp. SDUM812005]
MNNTLKVLLAIATFAGASAAQAVSIPTSGVADVSKTDYSASGGGEFHVEVTGYDSFYTFCVQRYEPLSALLDGTFSYTIAGSTSAGTHVKTAPNNVLSEGTVYLYRKFVAGALYNLADAVARKSNSISLQKAIWELEGEGAGLGQSSANNAFLATVYGLFGEAGAKADATDKTVKVLQLWDSQNNDLQDVLVYVPDSGATLALLGVALVGTAFIRRRLV